MQYILVILTLLTSPPLLTLCSPFIFIFPKQHKSALPYTPMCEALHGRSDTLKENWLPFPRGCQQSEALQWGLGGAGTGHVFCVLSSFRKTAAPYSAPLSDFVTYKHVHSSIYVPTKERTHCICLSESAFPNLSSWKFDDFFSFSFEAELNSTMQVHMHHVFMMISRI